ncbi:uncharacterized protein [Ptychodera flava]|uniref:uncharacterized protein n=1 Tax=Ptychodera flava TaxID=63121 RepID=UPI003969C945
MVGRVNTTNRESFELSEKSSIHDLIKKIRREFHQHQDDDILVYEPRTDGNISMPIQSTELSKYDNKELVFYVKGKPLSDETTAALKSEICGQNIACLGAPCHGKSSFINTVLKAFGKQPSASTCSGAVTGTKVYSPYRIEIENAAFSLWDVPGTAVKSLEDDKLKQTIKDILEGKQEPNKTIGTKLKRFFQTGQNIHAVLAIQDGQVKTEKLHVVAMQVASESGRAIPFYAVMTHIDKMDPKNIERKQEEISTALGIDRSNVLPIANYDHEGFTSKDGEDPQRDFHVRKFLLKVLGASKSYKDNLVVPRSDRKSKDTERSKQVQRDTERPHPVKRDTERPHPVKSSHATTHTPQVQEETINVQKPISKSTKKETKESRSGWLSRCTVI